MDIESTAWPCYVNAAPEELFVSKQVGNASDAGEFWKKICRCKHFAQPNHWARKQICVCDLNLFSLVNSLKNLALPLRILEGRISSGHRRPRTESRKFSIFTNGKGAALARMPPEQITIERPYDHRLVSQVMYLARHRGRAWLDLHRTIFCPARLKYDIFCLYQTAID
jgi:hypothetical protein